MGYYGVLIKGIQAIKNRHKKDTEWERGARRGQG
jgi:hypothetical protein